MLVLFWILYAMPAILLKIPFIQQKVADIATTELSDRLGVPVQIGSVNIEWFNRLVLKDLYLEDQQGEVLFEANHVAAGFEIVPLFRKQFVFTTARIFGFSFNLKKQTPESPLNLQFVIDAFASRDTLKKNPNFDLQFNSVLIRRGNFRFDIQSEPETPDRFNPKHIAINDLSARLSIRALTNDSINADIRRLSFEETSGVNLDKVSLHVIGNRDSMVINNFEIRMPETALNISRAAVGLSEVETGADFWDRASLMLDISPSEIYLYELAPFVPTLRNFTEGIELTAGASGTLNDINLRQLTLRYSDQMFFTGKMDLRGIQHPEDAYVFGQISKLDITTAGISGLVNNFSPKPVVLPPEIMRLGTIHFNGEISGFFDNLVAFGELSSAIGTVKTDLLFGQDKAKGIATFFSGQLSTTGLQIDWLFPAGNPYGRAQFNLNLNASRPENGTFSENVNAMIQEFEFKDYQYENIELAGSFRNNGFKGTIDVDDPNGQLHAEGMFRSEGEQSVFNFNARVENFHPDSLHLLTTYEAPDISFLLNADFTGNNIDNLAGNIRIDSLWVRTAPSEFFMEHVEVEASGHARQRSLTISSDLINGEVTGVYSFTTLLPGMMNTFKAYIPAFVNARQPRQEAEENNFTLLLTIENTEALSQTLKLPVTIVNQARITGQYSNIFNRFRLEGYLPAFRIGKSTFESGYLSASNPNDRIELELRAINYNDKGLRNYINLTADARDNTVNSLIGWANNKEELFQASLSTTTRFIELEGENNQNKLLTEITLNPSLLVISDTAWTISPARVDIMDGIVQVENFKIANEDQYLHIDGRVSKDPGDILLLDLNGIELSYIFDILNIPVLQFGGWATGIVWANDLLGNRILNTDLQIDNFSFNQVGFGRLNLYSEWDDIQQGIMLVGNIFKNDSSFTDVNGYIFPVGERSGLDLYFDATDINIAFLQPFMDNFAQDVQGNGFGQVRLYGPFSELNVVGNAYIQDGGLGIEFLNTYYTFSDSVFLSPTDIRLRDLVVYDRQGNTGTINFIFNHQHFRDFDFTAFARVENLMVYDATAKHNPLIYGTAYASGTAVVTGNEQVVDFDINMQTRPNTAVTMNFMGSSTAAEYDFITFVDRHSLGADTIVTDSIRPFRPGITENGTEIRMDITLDLTPDARVDLIIDPTAGDKITGTGTGNLQIQYGTRSDLRMYGNVAIVSGNYNFSLQQLIHKDFVIREGSTVDFRGDPYNATMDIEAIYRLTANLTDLDNSIYTYSNRTSVPVNCVLRLEGVLQRPEISFDIELPGSDSELERQVRSLIDTEEMMIRQVAYLLLLNKFYTSDYFQSDMKSNNELGAAASSALSSQLSSIINSITDVVQIGTNIRPGQEGMYETEYELLLSSQLLNNRLLFNGNFGYKNILGQTAQTGFVGEFDLEYLLIPSGEIRLKAYNHANNTYANLKQASTTQGVGIAYKKDFTRFADIFKSNRRLRLLPLLPTDTIPPAPVDTVVIEVPTP